ncbi:MAG: class B sortase [Ruminococcaceae bacterium]|nr:class B sortase [Oscillospiraceae bacterium]
MKKALLIILCVLFLGIAGYSGYQIYLQLREYNEGEKSYDHLAQYVQVEKMPEETEKVSNKKEDEEELQEEVINWPEVDFEELRAINPDIIGWIYIEGTYINYPIVQGKDNDYYLYRLFDGTSNRAGSIFLDYQNQPDFSDRHNIVYGHHLKNDTMFAALMKYQDQKFYEEHPYAMILTPEKNYKLEFFAGYVTNTQDESWKLSFESDEEYLTWIENAVKKSSIESGIVPSAEDRVLTLSTCAYDFDNARYVLLGVLK